MVYYCASQTPHVVDVEVFRLGLHNEPKNLRARLQQAIDENTVNNSTVNNKGNAGYDAIVLAYALCGQATAGLVARDVPLIIPRAHDCITLFLGSRARYQQEFVDHPGTYWYALDYMQRRDKSGTSLALGSGPDNANTDNTNMQGIYQEYVEKYGEDNANYLMEIMGAWQSHYKRAAFIDVGVGDGSPVERMAQDEAERRGWAFDRVLGDLVLVRNLLFGDWNEDFLVIPPGQRIAMAYDDQIMRCVPAG
jgi:hypothetical protein